MMTKSKHPGMIHVYTGNGKGKTTAAFGLALRAAGAGLQVFIAQFAKGMAYSEMNALKKLEHITIRQFGQDCFIINKPTDEDKKMAVQGLQESRKAMLSGKYDMIILDEAAIALYYHLFSLEELLELIDEKPFETEMIITGRYAPEKLIEKADLVTEMKEIKHYYTKGIQARIGIEK